MITVIICTYNPNPVFLKETVDGINKQMFKGFELIIVDNNSTPPVANLAFITENPQIKIIIEPKQGLTAARWAGAKAANNDILVFVDDDNILEETYLNNAYTIMNENPNLGMLSGRILPKYEVKPEKWFEKYEGMIAIKRLKEIHGLHLIKNNSNLYYTDFFPIGAGMVVRKRVIENYYLEHLKNNNNYIEGRKANELSSAEDIDFAFYCLSENLEIGISSELELIHIIPKFRIEMKYLMKLSISSLQSCYLVNEKWYSFFKRNIFRTFDLSKIELLTRIAIYTILNTKANQINKEFYKKVLELSK